MQYTEINAIICKISFDCGKKNIMKIDEIIKYIAECNGVSEEEVIKDMQDALDMAYQKPSNYIVKFNQMRIPRTKEIPTPEELIKYAVDKILDSIK